MKSLLKDIPDDESMLLMYLADELPPADRQKVEQRLGAEPDLRRQLTELSQLQEFCQKWIRALDEQGAADIPEAAALRRAARLLQQWAARQRRPEEAAQLISRPIPWLRYGLSAAAMIGLAYLVWWGNHPQLPPTQIATVTPDSTQDEDALPPDVEMKMLLNTMEASAKEDASDRAIAAATARSDEINFSVDVTPEDDSQ